MSHRCVFAVLLLVGCVPTEYCADTCQLAGDGECDDGRSGSVTGLCERGTDCTDCGPWGPASNAAPYGIYDDVPPVIAAGGRDGPCLPVVADCSEQVTASCTEDGTRIVYTSVVGRLPGCGGGVHGGCSSIAMRCPQITDDRAHQWTCVESFGGRAACYYQGNIASDRVTRCVPFGACDDGTPIERCTSASGRLEPTPENPGFFDVDVCSVSFRFGDDGTVRHQCGSCNSPCNLSIATASQLCAEAAAPEPPTNPPVSSDCRVQIDAQLRMLRALATTGCTSSCINTFASCAERSNCSDFTSCTRSATACLQRCAP